MRIRLALILIILSFGMIGCSDPETVGKNEAAKLNISSYFPEIGLKRMYRIGKEELFEIDMAQQFFDDDGNEETVISSQSDLTGGNDIDRIIQYKINDAEIRQIYRIDLTNNNETDILELTNQAKWETGDGDNTISYLTGIDLTMQVEAGSFKEVIEVTNVTKIDDDEVLGKKYYAPRVGLIKSIVITEEKEYVFQELASTQMTAQQSVINEPVVINEEKTEEIEHESKSYDGIVYERDSYQNDEYGFSFKIPEELIGRLKIRKSDWNYDALQTFDFIYSTEGIEQPVFSVVVYDGTIEESDWSHPMNQYIGANETYTFALFAGGDPSSELLDPANEEHLTLIQNTLSKIDSMLETFTY